MAWIKYKLNQNNIFKVGYEGIRKRIEDLQVLKVNDSVVTVTKNTNERYLNYYGDLSMTDYMFYVSAYVEITLDIILNNPNINWHWDTISMNHNITIKMIEENLYLTPAVALACS
jgi:hypothetical protein